MLKNELKVALRALLRHKGYAAINISGLAVGIASCILIMLFVRSEMSYDRFNKKADRIYRIWQKERSAGQDFINTVTPIPLAPAVSKSFAETEAACRVYAFNTLITVGKDVFHENVTMVDSTFFQLFDFELK